MLEEEVKRLVRRKKAEEKAAEAAEAPEESFKVDYAEVLSERLMRELGRRVTIVAGKRKKTITFCYEDNEDLDEIIKLLCCECFLSEV